LSLSSAGGEGKTLGSRAGNRSRHGSASQLSFTSSTQQTSDSSMLYKTDTTQSELAAGAAFSTSGLSGGAMNGYGNGADARTVFVSKTTIPRVERSSSSGMTERTFEKSSESRIGNGTSYTISYQHSTVRNVSSTLPRKQPTYVSSSSYSQYTNAPNKLSTNRRAYSSSTAVNDEPIHKDFTDVRSSSHPALTDLEREMAGLEGLIKDLNGITASQQAVHT